MKKFLILILAALPMLCAAKTKDDSARIGHYKAQKEVARLFNTSATPALNVVNKYGRIVISNWDQNAIDVQAEIKVTCSNTKKVQAILDCIDVGLVQTGNIVTVRTTIDSKSLEAIKGRNENANYQINITIKAPKSTTMSVENKYGHTQIESTSRALTAAIKYGDLTVGEIGEPSSVEIKYGNLAIEKASDLDLNIKYGNSKVTTMGNLRILESGYGNHKYGTVGSVTGSVKYDNYSFETVNGVFQMSECKYTNVTIENLNGALNIGELAYGNLKVRNLSSSFGTFTVAARYSGVSVVVGSGVPLRLSLRNSYGDINADNLSKGTFINKIYQGNSKSLELIIGNSPSNMIKISNRYGNISVTNK